MISKGLGCLKIIFWLVFANLMFGGFLVYGAYLGWSTWHLEKVGLKATGTVVRMNEKTDSEGSCCVYAPVIEFRDEGKAFSFTSSNYSSPPRYREGQQVGVIYDPANPLSAQIDKWTERWLVPLLLIPIMALGLIISNVALVTSWFRGNY